jgi:hypothetical protein
MKLGTNRESVMQPAKMQRMGSLPSLTEKTQSKSSGHWGKLRENLMQPQRRKSLANLTERTDSELSRATSDINRDFARRPSSLNLEETSALAGAAGIALARMKKSEKWDINGRRSIEEVPLTKEELEEEMHKENENDDDTITPLVRCRFHRLVYQKARATRGDYGEVERKSFRMAANDMLHAVHISFHVIQAQRLWMSLLQGAGKKKKTDDAKDQHNLYKVLSDGRAACEQEEKDQEVKVNGNWMDLVGDLDLGPDTATSKQSRCGSKASVISHGMTTACFSHSGTKTSELSDAFTMSHTVSEETNQMKASCLSEEQEQETVVGA